MIYWVLDIYLFSPWSFHGKRRVLDLVYSNFYLEVTMDDASMEIPGNDGGRPNLWLVLVFIVGSYVYCFLLLIPRSNRDYFLMGQETDNNQQEGDHLLPRIDSFGIDIDQLLFALYQRWRYGRSCWWMRMKRRIKKRLDLKSMRDRKKKMRI